jgi:anti-anti-sigma factor
VTEPRPPDQLLIHRRADQPGTVTLAVSGEIDLASAELFGQELAQAERDDPDAIVLDLAGLDFIDSTGIVHLLRAQQRAEQSGHRLTLTNVPAHAERLFKLTGIEKHLEIL